MRIAWETAVDALLAANGGEVTVIGKYSSEAHHVPEYNNFCAYAVQVTVDRETGEFTIDEVVMVCDVGTIINPIAHQGQLDGGFMMSIGTATMEELHVEEGRITNLSFADYKVPTMKDIPPFRTILIREQTGPRPVRRASGRRNSTSRAWRRPSRTR